ncbi:MAG: N-formylglutamate amidohydrolase, partial [Flavobacteriales bacterium]
MTTLFLSCEHGGNEVPLELQPCFTGHSDVLQTHRGLDIGALDLFHHLAPLAEETTSATLSRLCIELNRSEGHRQLFSKYTGSLDPPRKEELLAFHRSYWQNFIELIQERIAAGDEVMHVAVHSFTPVLDGVTRQVDIGFLYDPARSNERSFCMAWRKALATRMPALVLRMNQPYKGTSDGFPTALRRLFPAHYGGMELEVNQRFAPNGTMDQALAEAIRDSLAEVMAARQ